MRDRSTIQCLVKSYRQAKGWSQDQLAQKIGIRRQAVFDIESSRYLPNTSVALRLARELGCRVEDLFVEEDFHSMQQVTLMEESKPRSARIALAKVRGRLLGFPLAGKGSMANGFRAADALLSDDAGQAKLFCPPERLEKTVLLMGCDPAFEILAAHVARLAPDARVFCLFASSHKALKGLAAGHAHLAGTHVHNTGDRESNVVLAQKVLAGMHGSVIAFSLMEEGLMIAAGNPKGIRSVSDLSRPEVTLANRETGAALRALLDDRLGEAGIPPSSVRGYDHMVSSHIEGAQMVAFGAADAALGLRAVADAFELGFVPLAEVRCDLVFPSDMLDHPTVKILLDVLQSRTLRNEISSLSGYEASLTGKKITDL